MWIPDRGREGRGQVPATSPAHGAQRSRKGRRRRLGRILPKLYFIGSIMGRVSTPSLKETRDGYDVENTRCGFGPREPRLR